MRKAREGLSRPVLIGRAACPLRPPPCRPSGAAGGVERELSLRDAPSGRAPAPLLRGLRLAFLPLPVADFWPVALAGLSHPFPSRTRTLRAPAAMVLRPGAWESSAPPVFLTGPRPRLGRGRGPFSFPARHGARASSCRAASCFFLLARKHVSLQYIIISILGERKRFLQFGVL